VTRARRITGAAALVVIAGVGVATTAGFFGSVWWALDLCSHFPVVYGAAALAAGGAAAAVRRFVLTGIAALLFMVNLIVVAPSWIGPDLPAKLEGPRLEVLLLNVNMDHGGHDKVAALIRREDPDVIALLEVDDRWAAGLAEALRPWPERQEALRGDRFGVALYSRRPIRRAWVETYAPADVPTIFAELDVDGVPFTVVVTHPPPPVSATTSRARDRHLNALAARREQLGRRYAIVGDLNASPWSAAFGGFARRLKVSDTRRGFGIQASWPAWLPLFRIPIDHVLVSEGVFAVDRRIGVDVGSDHLPVIVQLVVTP
jgi:endonuclease/exonuclease/phosphatase (EEP) superfamily protein YafD